MATSRRPCTLALLAAALGLGLSACGTEADGSFEYEAGAPAVEEQAANWRQVYYTYVVADCLDRQGAVLVTGAVWGGADTGLCGDDRAVLQDLKADGICPNDTASLRITQALTSWPDCGGQRWK